MAAARRFAVQLSSPNTIHIFKLSDGLITVRGNKQSFPRGISTSTCCMKNTPHTVGTPAWAKASQRRRRSLAKLDKPKTLDQIEAEYRLSNDPTRLDFYTTTKNAKPKTAAHMDDQPEIVLTKNKSAFVFYHPEKQHPQALLYSKNVTEKPWWHLTEEEVKDYKDKLSEEEIKEARELRLKDPKLWTINSLSRLFQVKPLAIILAAPLTEEQKFEVDVERKLLNQWSEYKRKDYRANQELDRQTYVEQTRGVEMNKALGLKGW